MLFRQPNPNFNENQIEKLILNLFTRNPCDSDYISLSEAMGKFMLGKELSPATYETINIDGLKIFTIFIKDALTLIASKDSEYHEQEFKVEKPKYPNLKSGFFNTSNLPNSVKAAALKPDIAKLDNTEKEQQQLGIQSSNTQTSP